MGSGSKIGLTAKIYEDLKDKIMFGALLPGTVLTEGDLCDDYAVSRTPVRESLLQLEKEGYVSIEPRKSTKVSKISIREIDDLIEARLLMEPYIIRNQTGGFSQDFIDTLADISRQFQEMDVDAPDALAGFLRLDLQFHSTLVRLSKNTLLVQTCCATLEKSVRQWYLMCTHSEKRMSESMSEHQDIISTMLAGNCEEAGRMLEQHIKSFYDIAYFY